MGFESPLGDDGMLCLVVGDCALLAINLQERKVTGNEVKTALKPRQKEFEARTGNPPSRPELLQLKDEIKTDLMRTTNPVSSTVYVLIDRSTDRLYLSTTTKASLDNVTPFVRKNLNLTLTTDVSVSNLTRVLTNFVRNPENTPENFQLGDRAGLFDSVAESTVTIRGDDLTSSEIVALLSTDKQVESLQLRIVDKATFVLHQDWSLRSLKVDLTALDDETGSDDSMAADLQATLLIYGQVLREINATLQQEVDNLPE